MGARPGEVVRVVDDEDGVNLRTRIVSVTKDDAQGDPGTVTVTLANKSQDIAATLDGPLERPERLKLDIEEHFVYTDDRLGNI